MPKTRLFLRGWFRGAHPEPVVEESMSPPSLEDQAAALADADADLLYTLVQARRDSSLTVAVVAERIGWSEKKVRWFESYWADPNLSDIRRYALATGAQITHTTRTVK